MKTYKDYLIDFDALKVGDKLFSKQLGHCEVIAIYSRDHQYPVSVRSVKGDITNIYTEKGFNREEDPFASLFKEKPDFFKERKEVKRWKWYFEYSIKLSEDTSIFDSDTTNLKFDESNFLSWFKMCIDLGKKGAELLKYEKIDCTETTEVIYE